ncbi:MAG: hypothetical protein ACM3X9_08895 [Bacillota bacterium]
METVVRNSWKLVKHLFNCSDGYTNFWLQERSGLPLADIKKTLMYLCDQGFLAMTIDRRETPELITVEKIAYNRLLRYISDNMEVFDW